MKRVLKVIAVKAGYVEEHEYSQGESSYSVTDNVLKALDLNNYKFNAEFTEKCFLGPNSYHAADNPQIQEFKIELERV